MRCARRSGRALAALALSLSLGCGGGERAQRTDAEILWDRYGVPHVYADDDVALMRAFGWAQMQAHGDLLLTLYGQARGRAAEYWGESFLASDRWTWRAGIPDRARAWHEQQDPSFRALLDAFAAGVNAFGELHPERIDAPLRAVLPVDGVDVLAHAQQVLHFTFVANVGLSDEPSAGSNAWAIAPSRSKSGAAMLLANPHLPWSDRYTFFEAHLESPGFSAYGAALVGLPVLGIAFNDRLGWTHTVNAQDGVDLYELELDGDGYRFDGERRAFEVETRDLRVRLADGSLESRALTIRRSVHGPLVREDPGRALALRVVGLDRPEGLRQWWDMGRAKEIDQFRAVLSRMQLPVFSVIYADRSGHVLHAFGGLTPKRPDGVADWSGVVDGSSSRTLWTGVLGFHELPLVVDPPTGWLQNANDPPWSTTFPAALDPASFASHLAPPSMSLRAQRSARMLAEDDSIGFDELVADKHSTEVEAASRVLDALLEACASSTDPRIARARDVLAAWDRRVDAKSRGAVLFLTFMQRLGATSKTFAQGWSASEPLATPRGLADASAARAALVAAADLLDKSGHALDVAWGDVFRLRRGDLDLPASGGMGSLGVFRVLEFAADRDGRKRAVAGDSFVAAVHFGEQVSARVLLVYGNWSRADSPHAVDQLELAARGELREAWLEREAVEQNLASSEWVPR